MKFIALGLGVALYLAILVLAYLGYIHFFKVDVVFYSSIYAALIALLLFTVTLHFVPLFRRLNHYEKFNAIVIAALLGYVFAISLPTVIDRSLSFYILEKIQQRGGGIKKEAFEEVFTEEYMNEFRLVDVRLTEQLESSTIEIINDCVMLTKKGSLIANFGSFFRANLLPKRRLLMGEYTDVLTNPFRNSKENINYKCAK